MFLEPISIVQVCVGYADFLVETLPLNRIHAFHMVVVTVPSDTDTREICRRHRVQCLVTEDVSRDGEFSKGRMIERGLQHLPAEGWILHLDADIVLPGRFRHDLARAHLEPEKLHGFDRFNVQGWDKWQKLKASGWLFDPYSGHPHTVAPPPGYELGARWAGQDGWVPIGFAQLWNRKLGEEEWRGARVRGYPVNHGGACRSDVQHSLQWDRRDRVLVPEIFVAHLESEGAATGINWKGRRSVPFGPSARGGKPKNVGY